MTLQVKGLRSKVNLSNLYLSPLLHDLWSIKFKGGRTHRNTSLKEVSAVNLVSGLDEVNEEIEVNKWDEVDKKIGLDELNWGSLAEVVKYLFLTTRECLICWHKQHLLGNVEVSSGHKYTQVITNRFYHLYCEYKLVLPIIFLIYIRYFKYHHYKIR